MRRANVGRKASDEGGDEGRIGGETVLEAAAEVVGVGREGRGASGRGKGTTGVGEERHGGLHGR